MNYNDFDKLMKIATVGRALSSDKGTTYLDRYLKANGYTDNQIIEITDVELSDDHTTLAVEFRHGVRHSNQEIGYVYIEVNEEGNVKVEF